MKLEVIGLRVRSTRATAATNALANKAEIAKVLEWLGHSTTRLYEHRDSKPQESPTSSVPCTRDAIRDRFRPCNRHFPVQS